MNSPHRELHWYEARGIVRIVDESGEDYLYPEEYFRPVELPPPIAELYFAALRHDP